MNFSYGNIAYNIDIVFCIDVSESMKHMLENVKQAVLTFYDDLKDTIENPTDGHPPKRLNSVRIRVIAFRDYKYDGDRAMQATGFFSMPEQRADLKKCVDSLRAEGGGYGSKNALEALAYAIRSPWIKHVQSGWRRQITVVWTNSAAHPIGFRSNSPCYPENMAGNFRELTDWWYNEDFVGSYSKLLVVIAPDEEEWSMIADNWENTMYYDCENIPDWKDCVHFDLFLLPMSAIFQWIRSS